MIFKIKKDTSVFMYVSGIKSFEKRLWLKYCFGRFEHSAHFFGVKSRCFLNDFFDCMTHDA